jgi:hypothetical protein
MDVRRRECIVSPILRGSDCPGFSGKISGLLTLKNSVPVSQKIRIGKRPGFFYFIKIIDL